MARHDCRRMGPKSGHTLLCPREGRYKACAHVVPRTQWTLTKTRGALSQTMRRSHTSGNTHIPLTRFDWLLSPPIALIALIRQGNRAPPLLFSSLATITKGTVAHTHTQAPTPHTMDAFTQRALSHKQLASSHTQLALPHTMGAFTQWALSHNGRSHPHERHPHSRNLLSHTSAALPWGASTMGTLTQYGRSHTRDAQLALSHTVATLTHNGRFQRPESHSHKQ